MKNLNTFNLHTKLNQIKMKKILFSIGIAFLFLWLIGLIIGVEFPEIVGIENNIEKGAYFLNITLVALLDILLLILGKKN